MEKEVKLFDKRFVHFMWDDELKGKQCFVADYIDTIQALVEKGDENTLYLVTCSNDERKPFRRRNRTATRQFAYYDPNYEVKRAFYKEGKKVQSFLDYKNKWFDVAGEPSWLDGIEYRIKPESLGYARVETKDSDFDKSEGYTLAVSKCHWEDYIDHALPKENILDKTECTCEEKTFRPFKDCDELVEFWSKNYQTGFRPAYTKPLIWVRLKCDGRERLIVAFGKGFGSDFVEIGNKAKAVTLQKLFDDYEFLDKSPVGMEVKE